MIMLLTQPGDYLKILAIPAKGEQSMNTNNQGDTSKTRDELKRKSVRLPQELSERLRHHAQRNNLSYNSAVIQCVEYALTHMEESDGTDKQ